MTLSAATIDTAFAEIVAAAVAGDRCPTNGTGAVTSNAVGALARDGRIRVLISSKNYRTVEILVGKHAGRYTAPDPAGRPPWKKIDARGTHVHGKLLSRATAAEQRGVR